MELLRPLVFLLGLVIVGLTMRSALSTFVVPRSIQDKLTRVVFVAVWLLFRVRLLSARDYYARDKTVAFYAPIALLVLLFIWLCLVIAGYACMFWATGIESWYKAFKLSGSSLLTLGFETVDDALQVALVFSEAILGLIFVALLIGYLPTMYSAFSKREVLVTMLEVRAGSPPSALTLITRYHRITGFGRIGELWAAWEVWFSEVDESHTSLPALIFFRSPHPDHSWVTAAGTVLDAVSLVNAVVDVPHDPQADLCIRAGYLALHHVADYFDIPYKPNPTHQDPISITHAEFDAACDELIRVGVPLKADRERAWRDFKGWRVNYDTVLLALCSLTLAPTAPWTGDRAHWTNRPWFRGNY